MNRKVSPSPRQPATSNATPTSSSGRRAALRGGRCRIMHATLCRPLPDVRRRSTAESHRLPWASLCGECGRLQRRRGKPRQGHRASAIWWRRGPRRPAAPRHRSSPLRKRNVKVLGSASVNFPSGEWRKGRRAGLRPQCRASGVSVRVRSRPQETSARAAHQSSEAAWGAPRDGDANAVRVVWAA